MPVPALIIMGVSGSGKTTLAQRLSLSMGLEFIEGDDLHGPANIAKMRRGEPLDDADRAPWLAAIARRLVDSTPCRGVVISCSALKRAYRDALRVDPGIRFIFLDADREQLEHRLALRQGHFMPPGLLGSQFDTLERPQPDERDVLTLPAGLPPDDMLARAEGFLAQR